MKKIKNRYKRVDYYCLDLYYEDLIDIIDIISKHFEQYKLKLDDNEITNEDDIKEDLEEIKNEGIEVIYSLDLNSSSGSPFDDSYINLNIEIDEYMPRIYTHYSSTLVKGVIDEINEILIRRTKKFGKIIFSTYYNWYYIFSCFSFILLLIAKIWINIPNLLIIALFLVIIVNIILMIIAVLGKYHKNRIYLLKYNEKNSLHSKVKQHMGELILLIVGTVIGGVVVSLISYFFL